VTHVEVVAGGSLGARAAVWVADRVWAAVADRGVAHLAVSGGTTPVPMFETLAGLPLPWSEIHVWQVDERVAPAGDPDRNLVELQSALLDHVHPAGVHVYAVEQDDLEAAAAAYHADLVRSCAGVIDVMHLGLGPDGHTASWPPGDPVIDVTDRFAAVCQPYNGRRRLTMTVPAVTAARERMLLVDGEGKADAVAKVLRGDPSIPASRVPADRTTLLLDPAAAANLRGIRRGSDT
jgi:6-phosphogluconolactonase